MQQPCDIMGRENQNKQNEQQALAVILLNSKIKITKDYSLGKVIFNYLLRQLVFRFLLTCILRCASPKFTAFTAVNANICGLKFTA
jgi:hypothetical protein